MLAQACQQEKLSELQIITQGSIMRPCQEKRTVIPSPPPWPQNGGKKRRKKKRPITRKRCSRRDGANIKQSDQPPAGRSRAKRRLRPSERHENNDLPFYCARARIFSSSEEE